MRPLIHRLAPRTERFAYIAKKKLVPKHIYMTFMIIRGFHLTYRGEPLGQKKERIIVKLDGPTT